MIVKMKVGVFGFDKGFTYSATPSEDKKGYIAVNGVFKGFVFNKDVEVVEWKNAEVETLILNGWGR